MCHLDVAEVSGEISNDLHRAQILSLSGQHKVPEKDQVLQIMQIGMLESG